MHSVISTLLLATGLTVLGNSVDAQQGATVEAVEAANQRFYEAASARDLAQMDTIWAHEPYVRAIHPGQPIDAGWKAVRAGWQNLFEQFPEISVTMPEPHMRVGEDIAWVTGMEHFRGRQSSGEEVSATLLGTSVYERAGEHWRMVHHHVSVLPPPEQ